MPEPKKSFLYWAVLIIIFVVTVGWLFWSNRRFLNDYQSYFSNMPATQVSRPTTVHLQIEFSNDKKRAFRGPAIEDLTALSALKASAEVGRFPVETNSNGEVIRIADMRNYDGHRWALFLNNDPTRELAGQVFLKAGDRVVFRYE